MLQRDKTDSSGQICFRLLHCRFFKDVETTSSLVFKSSNRAFIMGCE